MHYHYFTLEQRDALRQQIRAINSRGQAPDEASALESLRSPSYGICEACEADIPFAQLLDNPLERLCRRCRQAKR